MKYYELYKRENQEYLKIYLKEWDNSAPKETCWKIKDGQSFIVCEENPQYNKEPDLFCRVRDIQSRRYADTEIIIDIKAEKKYSEDEIVKFIQKNADVECKKYNAPDLNWWFDR